MAAAAAVAASADELLGYPWGASISSSSLMTEFVGRSGEEPGRNEVDGRNCSLVCGLLLLEKLVSSRICVDDSANMPLQFDIEFQNE
jgi:hypothetical protein